MSAGAVKHWLVAYDICAPRRLRQVHRRLRQEGLTVQYSAFSVLTNDQSIRKLLDDIEALIDTEEDDVRAYHVPARCEVWTLGAQGFPGGVLLEPADALRLFVSTGATLQPSVTVDESEPARKAEI